MAPRNFNIQSQLGDQLIVDLIQSVAGELNTETAVAFKRLEKAIREDQGIKGRLREMHKKLAEEAEGVARGAYNRSTLINRGKGYRSQDGGNDKRYPGGIDRAFDAGYFFNVSNDGALVFLNLEKLFKFAPHWRRLNYGADPAPATKVPIRPMRFGRGVGRKSPGFKFAPLDRNPSSAFKIPWGVWSSSRLDKTPSNVVELAAPSGKNDAFYRIERGTKRKQLSTKTKGIRGTGFLDRGLDHINQEYPKRLKALAESEFGADIKKAKPKGKKR